MEYEINFLMIGTINHESWSWIYSQEIIFMIFAGWQAMEDPWWISCSKFYSAACGALRSL